MSHPLTSYSCVALSPATWVTVLCLTWISTMVLPGWHMVSPLHSSCLLVQVCCRHLLDAACMCMLPST